MRYEQWVAALAGERLPLAVLDLDAFDRNVERVATLAPEGMTLRVASKALRVPSLIRRVLDRGAPFGGVLCYAAREVELLASRGLDDMLLAYPTAQAADTELLVRLHLQDHRVYAVVDSVEAVLVWARAVDGLAIPFPLVIELELPNAAGVGATADSVHHGFVRDVEGVMAVLDEIDRHAGLRYAGLVAYEAHPARSRVMATPLLTVTQPLARLAQRKSRRRIASLREEVVAALAQREATTELFNGGGTRSLGRGHVEPWLTELSVGSGFVCPNYLDGFGDLELEPSLYFALQVVGRAEPGSVVCQAGGLVTSSSSGWRRAPTPWLPEGLSLAAATGDNELQTHLHGADGTLELGDPVLFRHGKSGELAEHFDEYLLLSEGEIVGRAPTYRGLGCCFP